MTRLRLALCALAFPAVCLYAVCVYARHFWLPAIKEHRHA